jgi:hypothetical protein
MDDSELLLLVVTMMVVYYVQTRVEVRPLHQDRLRGHRMMQEWFARPALLYRQTGLKLHTFHDLVGWIRQETDLDDTRYMTLDEKVAIFLYICRHGAGHDNAEDMFGRATDTVSRFYIHPSINAGSVLTVMGFRAFNAVLKALVLLHQQIIEQPTPSQPVPSEILHNSKFFPYFKDCVGAVDGTHIHAHIPRSEQAAWRNRKGYISQNVFAACSFDLSFTFIHAGWEGSAHDTCVLKDALQKKRFRPPQNRYYLADAGFYNCDFLLIPYPKTRYHLREYAKSVNLRPETKEELFNLRHAQLRNAIERIFGVLKRKFKILTKAPEYEFQQQVNLVLALTALHNFIQQRDRYGDADFEDLEEFDTWDDWNPPAPPTLATRATTAKSDMEKLRDVLAEQMWSDYIEIVHLRGRLV